MKYPVLHSQILKKNEIQQNLPPSNIMRSLSIHCLFTHWHLKLYKKINKKCEFNILVLVLLVTRSVCGTFYIFYFLFYMLPGGVCETLFTYF